ncbi:E3 ubiquitin/ISG15 ligase TRIM25-like [Rana temporaria]|uniref:E3 ubiquitin/ISG15 ligase TRIM25-like n=1 Tax=Rana temporaria TaxID=8407 RepID=UPI001AAC5A91|nr:E3 ubiquitin/ISG15 ligase TRIM25-like [Rana temporaria]
MAAADLRDELNCSICLNVYEDPIILRCGHNFCSTCIGHLLTSQEGSGGYSCPQCRMRFVERPELQRNIALRNIAERFQSTHPEEELGGVLCTYCINSSVLAVKTCVHCQASLCEGHVKMHNKSPEHVLIEPTTYSENRKCPKHKKILEFYCCEDSVCICVSCRLDGTHKGHQVESIEDAFEKKREKLRNVLGDLSSHKAEARRRIQTLLGHKDKVKRKAATFNKKVTNLFRDVHKKLEALEKRILDEGHRQEEEATNSVTDLIRHLEAEIDEFSNKIIMAEKLYNITDPLSLSEDNGTNKEVYEDSKGTTTREGNDVKDLHEGPTFKSLLKGLFDIVNQVRSDTLQTDPEVVLDANTAGKSMRVSEDLKTVTSTEISNDYPTTPRRFSINQVLSKTRFSSGRHYWEVLTSERGNWRIGVAYVSIDTKGKLSAIGSNRKSWCLRRFYNKYSVMHGQNEIHCMQTFSSHRFGVYLDYEEGRLSFYELCDPVRHIYTFHTTFTEPLHAAFLVTNGFVKIMNMPY